jgi:hypothetical protein
VSYWDSGCKDTPPAESGPCPDDDLIAFTPGPGMLHVLHENATYNCCPDDLVIAASVAGHVITLTETEVLTTPCDCDCCYDVEALVANLAPGTYAVEFSWLDYGTWTIRVYKETVEIP